MDGAVACRSFPNKLKRLKHIRTKDRSYLNPDEVAWQELPREQASTLVLSFCLTSSVSNKYVFDMCMLPQRRERGCSSAKQILLWSGQIQQAVCDANCGIPSDGIAFDNATSNGLLNSSLSNGFARDISALTRDKPEYPDRGRKGAAMSAGANCPQPSKIEYLGTYIRNKR